MCSSFVSESEICRTPFSMLMPEDGLEAPTSPKSLCIQSALFQPDRLPPHTPKQHEPRLGRTNLNFNIEGGDDEAAPLQGRLRTYCPSYFSHSRTEFAVASLSNTSKTPTRRLYKQDVFPKSFKKIKLL